MCFLSLFSTFLLSISFPGFAAIEDFPLGLVEITGQTINELICLLYLA